MTDQRKHAEYGTSVYLIEINGQPFEMAVNFREAMKRIAYHITGSIDVIRQWGIWDDDNVEFSSLDSVELAGSFLHRVRYAAGAERDIITISEHRLRMFNDPTLADRIAFTTEFDPSYELAVGLYSVAQGTETVEGATDKLRSIVGSGVKVLRRSNYDDDFIVRKLRMIEERMESAVKLIPDRVADSKQFLDQLPQAAADRFAGLAREAFPEEALAPAR